MSGGCEQRAKEGGRTDTNVDLAEGYLVRDLVDTGEAGGALAVDGVDRRGVRDAGVERGHAGGAGAAARGEDVADCDVLDEGGVELGFGVDGAEDGGEDFFGVGVFEAAFARLV